MTADEAKWRRRFFIFMAVRLAGAAIVFLGIAIAFGDLIRDGGWRTGGMIIAAMGLIDVLFAPRLLKKQWEIEDRQ